MNPCVRSEEDGKTIPINLTGCDSPSDKEQHQKISINLTDDADAFEEGQDHGDTFENDKYSWTESCQIIEPFLPPSLSACYLYVQDKAKKDVVYTPGVSIINPPMTKRPPEIFVCAVKCANTNEINFIYAKSEAVNTVFEGK